MELEFKPDFEQARQRWDAYWNGERLDRPVASIVAVKSGTTPVRYPPFVRCMEEDPDPVIDHVLAWGSSHEFMGEAIPFTQVFFGPDHLAALLGADLKIHPSSPETTWAEHIVDDWDDAEIEVKWDGYWWRRTVEMIRAFRGRLDGKLVLGFPTLQGGLDCLVALCGVEKLLMDLIEAPEKIKEALGKVDRAYDQVTEALSKELGTDEYGGINRHGMYRRGTINVPQCDVSCMLSPEMFREFGLPSVVHEAKTLSAADYHLDGPDAIKHLEAICELSEITAIQWQPGAGQAAQTDWSELHRRIDSLGKGQLIFFTDFEQVRWMTRELQSPQLFFTTQVESVQDGERLLTELQGLRH